MPGLRHHIITCGAGTVAVAILTVTPPTVAQANETRGGRDPGSQRAEVNPSGTNQKVAVGVESSGVEVNVNGSNGQGKRER